MPAPKFGGPSAFDFKTARRIVCRARRSILTPTPNGQEESIGICDSQDFEQMNRMAVWQNRLDSADFLIQPNPCLRCMKCGALVNFEALMKEQHG